MKSVQSEHTSAVVYNMPGTRTFPFSIWDMHLQLMEKISQLCSINGGYHEKTWLAVNKFMILRNSSQVNPILMGILIFSLEPSTGFCWPCPI